jgi:hypothetical protein
MNKSQLFIVLLIALVAGLVGLAIFAWRRRSKNHQRSSDPIIVTLSNSNHKKALKAPSKVLVTFEDGGAPLAELEKYVLIEGEKLAELPNQSEIGSFMQPVLQRLPELVNQGSKLLGLTYRVKFSPQTTWKLFTGASKLLRTSTGSLKATAVSASGIPLIQEGAVVASKAGNPAAAVLIVWQVAAIVTAQKYLADIDRKLGSIGSKLDEVLGLMHDQMLSKLKAYIAQLEQKYKAISSGAFSEDDIVPLACFFDNVEHECLATLGTADSRISQTRKDIIQAAKSKDKAKLIELCQTLDKYSRLWYSAAFTRLIATQVRALFPQDQAATSAALNDTKSRTSQFAASRLDFLREWRGGDMVNGKKERLPIFRTKHHQDVAKQLQQLNNLSKKRGAHVAELCSATEEMIAAHAKQLSQPLEIQVCTEPDGRFKSAYLIQSSASFVSSVNPHGNAVESPVAHSGNSH